MSLQSRPLHELTGLAAGGEDTTAFFSLLFHELVVKRRNAAQDGATPLGRLPSRLVSDDVSKHGSQLKTSTREKRPRPC